jgi:O-antigen ligase
VFGDHPFQVSGVVRYFGFRPLGFFEDGNQYGIWMALAALAAVSRVLTRPTRARIDIAIAVLLVACAIAAQSIGAIILLALGAAWLAASVSGKRIGLVVAGLLFAVGGTAYASGKVPLEHWAKNTAPGQAVVGALKASGRASLGWRVKRDQDALPMIWRAPLTGYGKWDWWRPLKSHPWGLPLLIAGQFGLLSMLLAALAMFGGAAREMWRCRSSALPIMVVAAGVDACLNSCVYLPAILAAGALAVPRTEDSDGI